jgi:type VI secretion system secreted protein Hcp
MPIYMKFEGIDGDVTATGHVKWIELNSMQWGVGRGIASATGQAAEREASAPSISEVTITKMMDKTTPLLFTESLIGDGKKVEIHLVKTGKDKLDVFMEYVLTDTMISGYSVSSGGDTPSESLSLNFTKVELKYHPHDNKGKAGSPIPAGYDIGKGAKI